MIKLTSVKNKIQCCFLKTTGIHSTGICRMHVILLGSDFQEGTNLGSLIWKDTFFFFFFSKLTVYIRSNASGWDLRQHYCQKLQWCECVSV